MAKVVHERQAIHVYASSVVAVCKCGWAKDRPRVLGAYEWVAEALDNHISMYNKYVLCSGASDDDRHAGYKNVQLKFQRDSFSSKMQHGVQSHKKVIM